MVVRKAKVVQNNPYFTIRYYLTWRPQMSMQKDLRMGFRRLTSTPPRFGTRTVAGGTAKMVQKWRIHFTERPMSWTSAALVKPVTTDVLVRNLCGIWSLTKKRCVSVPSPFCHLIAMRTRDCPPQRRSIEAYVLEIVGL